MAKKTEPKTKEEMLKDTLKAIDKDMGKGTLQPLVQATNLNVKRISSGILPLDIAMGGGLPRGRIIEIYGSESSGKTTIALQMIAEIQRNKGVGVFIDVEHTLDPFYAKNIGVNTDELLVSQPDTGEQALTIVDSLVRCGAVDMIVVDSVAALVPRTELDGDMGTPFVGVQARLMGQAMRKLTSYVAKSGCVLVFINQLRDKVGSSNPYGTNETTPGGRALSFYATIRIDVRRGETLKQDNQPVGNRARIKIVKNKVSPPFKLAAVDIFYGKGISKLGTLIDMAIDLSVIKKSGSWLSYGDLRLGQGKENAKKTLTENPEACQEITDKIMQEVAVGGADILMSEEEARQMAAEAAEAEANAVPEDQELMEIEAGLEDEG